MQRKRLILLCSLFLGCLISIQCLNAQSDTASTIALSNELNKLELYKLSSYLLDREIRNNPTDRDVLNVQKAEIYFSMKVEKEGLDILNKISVSSKAYAFSRLILGKYYWRKSEYKEVTTSLEKYFVKIKSNIPQPNEKFRIQEFNEAVVYLYEAYKKQNDTQSALKALGYLKWLAKDAGGGTPEEKKIKGFQDIIFNVGVKLDIAQQLRKEGKADWKKDVESVLPELEKILEDEGDMTMMTILAINEKLKACVMLEKSEDVKKLLETHKDTIRSLDSNFKKIGRFYEAPSAKMYLWVAEYNHALAQKEENKVKRIALNSQALKDFYRVYTTYGDKLCPHIPAAARGFNRVKKALEKDGKRITARVKPPIDFELEMIREFHKKKEYAKVIPIMLKFLRAKGGKSSKDAPEVLSLLTDSYINTGKILEAITIAGFMGDCFPDCPNTPVLLLNLGKIKWKEGEDKKNTPEGERAKAEAIIVYEWYTKTCPTHKYAADISAKVAMEYFIRATDMAKKANKMPAEPSEAKIKANLAAREEFKKPIPKFQYIVDNYSHTIRGKEAAFLIGNCYSSSFQYLKGSDTFAKYCELETNYPHKSKRDMGRVAIAKYRMADNYTRYAESILKEIEPLIKKLEKAPETVEENSKQKSKEDIQKMIDEKRAEANKYFHLAITNFREYTDNWMKPGGRLHGLTKKAAKDTAKSYNGNIIARIPWIYDRIGDTDKTIDSFLEFLKKFPDHKSVPIALKRIAFIYIDRGETAKGAKYLDIFTTKFPDKAHTIQIDLAKAMYDIKKYNKSIEAIAKLFEGEEVAKISVADMKWIGSNLYKCGGKHPEEGAALALKANQFLLAKLKEPVLTDWIVKSRIGEFEADSVKRKKTSKIIRDQILLESADAAYYSAAYAQTIKYLDEILAEENSPYFYKAHFKCAGANRKLKQYGKALKNYGEISGLLLSHRKAKESMKLKTSLLVGITRIEQGELGKALAAFAGPVMKLMTKSKEMLLLQQDKKEISPEEKDLIDLYVEYALFLSACCENALGNEDKADVFTNMYRETYPNGMFKTQLGSLPSPEKAIEKIEIITE